MVHVLFAWTVSRVSNGGTLPTGWPRDEDMTANWRDAMAGVWTEMSTF